MSVVASFFLKDAFFDLMCRKEVNMKENSKKIIGIVMALVMCISAVLCITGCESAKTNEPQTTESPAAGSETVATEASTADEADALWQNALYTEDTEIGEGNTTFYFEVKTDSKAVTFTVNTDETVLGTALLGYGLIDGDDSEYGLYVKYVNGIFADYNTDKHYWALYKDGEMMMTGVDGETIEAGSHYEMVYAQ